MSIERSMSDGDKDFSISLSSEQAIFDAAYEILSDPSNLDRIVFCRGSRMTTSADFYVEISASWQFPYYFRMNAAGVVDCMSDLTWMPSPNYVFIITSADQLLAKDRPEEFKGFISDMVEVSRRWREDVPRLKGFGRVPATFTIIFQCDAEVEEAFRKRLVGAGIDQELLSTSNS